MFALHGNGVGSGIAIGRARVLFKPGQEVPVYEVGEAELDREVARYRQAVNDAWHGLSATMEGLPSEGAGEVRGILNAHLLMLQDPELSEEPVRLIRSQKINAEAALQQHADHLESVFNEIDDPYLSSKSADVAQAINRVMGELAGDQGEFSDLDGGEFDGEIICANDLAPADTVDLKKHQISAFLTNLGGPISHTAILARSMKIPAIVGLHGGIRYLRTGDLLVIDGKRGVVLVNPDESAVETYRRRQQKIIRGQQALDSLVNETASSLDGIKVSLNSNIELPEEILDSVSQNADGVGLYRTEFLYMNRDTMPDEEEQLAIYTQVIRNSNRPVTIRTLDLGADKQVDGGRSRDSSKTNPALGRRAIRLCLHDLALFKPQLRAIYRAAAHGEIRMMIPMVSNVDELDQLDTLLGEVKDELEQQGMDYNPSVPVGGMVEVPAAAIAADLFAQRLDFLSIGTNDLIQYTLAIDRIDDEVNYLYDPLHPSILRLVQLTIQAGARAGIPVSMCGEMASDPKYTRILLGMGLRDFSMDPGSILEIKQRVRLTDVEKIRPRVEKLLDTMDMSEIRRLVETINS